MDQKKPCYGLRNGEDRISNLPDCIIRQILSSLETREAVQTSILSTRWKHLWTDIPSLNFIFKHNDQLNNSDLLYFPDHPLHSPDYSPTSPNYSSVSPGYSPVSPGGYCCCGYYSPASHENDDDYNISSPNDYTPPDIDEDTPKHLVEYTSWRFHKFVYEFLNRHGGSKLDKFKFETYDVGLDKKFIHYILSQIVKANVREVVFNARTNLSFGQFENLPECLYSSTSIKKLQMGITGVTLSKGFPSLKVLRLHNIFYRDDSGICPEFFSTCSSLESLSFSDCKMNKLLIMNISSPKLKKLEIHDSCFDQVVVSSPLLSFFKFGGADVVELVMDEKCGSLEEVDIDVTYKSYAKAKKEANKLVKMLKELANAKSVVVSMDTLWVLSKATGLQSEPSPFPFLKTLMLRTDWTIPENGWNFLLQNAATDVETSILVPSAMPRVTTQSFKTY